MKKRALLTIFFYTPLVLSMHKTEIQSRLSLGKTIEEVALETFKPSYEDLDCWQSSRVKVAKLGYMSIPIATVALPALAIFGLTGDYKVLLGSFAMLYPLGHFDWYNHHYASATCSNKIAKHYAPQDYQLHFNTCQNIYTEMEEKEAREKAYSEFQRSENEKNERKKQLEFEKIYKHQSS